MEFPINFPACIITDRISMHKTTDKTTPNRKWNSFKLENNTKKNAEEQLCFFEIQDNFPHFLPEVYGQYCLKYSVMLQWYLLGSKKCINSNQSRLY